MRLNKRKKKPHYGISHKYAFFAVIACLIAYGILTKSYKLELFAKGLAGFKAIFGETPPRSKKVHKKPRSDSFIDDQKIIMTYKSISNFVTAIKKREGGGFMVRRPIGEKIDQVDPFLMLDHLGPVIYGPGEAIGAPDHPHRGFETVTYVIEGK